MYKGIEAQSAHHGRDQEKVRWGRDVGWMAGEKTAEQKA